MPPKILLLSLVPLALLLLAGCTHPPRATAALPPGADPATAALAALRDDLTRAPDTQSAFATPVRLTGMGLSQVSTQPGGSLNEKRLMAIRAARMGALRDLTEQVHGIKISAEMRLRDQIMQDDEVRGIVAGELRGARTLSITPRGEDGYEVKMSLDPDTVRYIVRAARIGA